MTDDVWRKTWAILTAHQGAGCAIAQAKGKWAIPTERHHARIHNSKWARARFPLFIDSVFNLLLVEHGWHMSNDSFGKWSERKVAWYEQRMRKNPAMAAWANGRDLDWAQRAIARSALAGMDLPRLDRRLGSRRPGLRKRHRDFIHYAQPWRKPKGLRVPRRDDD